MKYLKTILESLFFIMAIVGMSAMDSEGIGLVIAIIMMFSGLIGMFIMENVHISLPRHQYKDKHKKVA